MSFSNRLLTSTTPVVEKEDNLASIGKNNLQQLTPEELSRKYDLKLEDGAQPAQEINSSGTSLQNIDFSKGDKAVASNIEKDEATHNAYEREKKVIALESALDSNQEVIDFRSRITKLRARLIILDENDKDDIPMIATAKNKILEIEGEIEKVKRGLSSSFDTGSEKSHGVKDKDLAGPSDLDEYYEERLIPKGMGAIVGFPKGVLYIDLKDVVVRPIEEHENKLKNLDTKYGVSLRIYNGKIYMQICDKETSTTYPKPGNEGAVVAGEISNKITEYITGYKLGRYNGGYDVEPFYNSSIIGSSVANEIKKCLMSIITQGLSEEDFNIIFSRTGVGPDAEGKLGEWYRKWKSVIERLSDNPNRSQ